MKAVSLFSGAGGMDIGFAKSGVTVIWANELDADAAGTYERNNPDTVLRQGDIKALKKELSQFGDGTIDLVFGGPPCQGFSVAGKMDPDDERSKLIWEFLDVVKTLKPKVFVMENVKALGKLQRWQSIREQIVKNAFDMGYTCFYKVLNAADFNVPQKRERVFFIGFHNVEFNVENLFESEMAKQVKPRIKLRDCLGKLPPVGTDGNPITCTAKISLAASPVMRKSPYAGMLFNGLGRPLDLDNQANTLPASMGGNKTPVLDELLLKNSDAENWVLRYHANLNKGKTSSVQECVLSHIRRITTVEAAAIQTFPPDYVFIGEKSSVYRQIGNAVPCNLAAAVAEATIKVHNRVLSQKISA
ncbi:MAG: DNA cytosine methyltransferase [Clostridiales bacterium]|jgi:DNA (cytosine-5)-methyltransferase 1|nr:DNA cytosine methyltransferase [Clostridiales bacterium]